MHPIGTVATTLLAALSVAPTQDRPSAADRPLRVVESLDLKRYAGRWYEVARLPNNVQRNCASDVVAHYSLRTDNRIDVVNRCRAADGSVDEAVGIARKIQPAGSSGRLEVSFGRAFLTRAWGDYWIIGLGPEYTWAVVGTPKRDHLWILSRAPDMTAASYAMALEIARAKGFDVTRLVPTQHTGRRLIGPR